MVDRFGFSEPADTAARSLGTRAYLTELTTQQRSSTAEVASYRRREIVLSRPSSVRANGQANARCSMQTCHT